MAKAPKTSSSTTSKRKTTAKRVAKAPAAPVEDAVVIEETPPETPSPKPSETAEQQPVVTPEPERQKPAEEAPKPKTRTKADKTPIPASKSQEPSDPKTGAESAPKQSAAPAPALKRGGTGAFIGVVLGGIVAAIIGFVAARYLVPEGWPFPGVAPEEDPVALAVAAQGDDLAALGTKLDTVAASVDALESDTTLATTQGDLTAKIDGINQTLADSAARLDDIESRLSAVEKLAPKGSAAAQMAAQAYDRELAALREMFQGELAKVEAAQTDATALKAQAAEAAKAAAGRAALARITAALDNGQPFAAALAALADATGITAPAGLADRADTGVPTLAALQDGFAPAARKAIDASIRAAVKSGEMGRFSAFMKTQLGTRSLEPKAGDDADAVLSRADAALKQGDLAAVLTELDGLPAAATPAMADWRAMAETRKAALDAGAALAQELNAK